jgi:hypothetical protein
VAEGTKTLLAACDDGFAARGIANQCRQRRGDAVVYHHWHCLRDRRQASKHSTDGGDKRVPLYGHHVSQP